MTPAPKFILTWEQKPREAKVWEQRIEYYQSEKPTLDAYCKILTGDTNFGPIEYRNVIVSRVVYSKD